MWSLVEVIGAPGASFSDGKPLDVVRGGDEGSYRLIINDHGFLDLTEAGDGNAIYANSSILIHNNLPSTSVCLYLHVNDGGVFELMAFASHIAERSSPPSTVQGRLKPLPNVSAEDAAFIDRMMDGRYIPYQNIPESPGKTVGKIKRLGLQYFAFTPYSFQLAMCVYDWTTASFARLVLLKIFEYTGIHPPPFPIDRNSLASQIWTSDWESYGPNDPDYMRSFMMKPAGSLDDVKAQLDRIIKDLHSLSDVENRLLAAAIQSLPRTSVIQHPQLFSGQVDMSQLGLEYFGIEFLECPLNRGPVDAELVIDFADALRTYVAQGKIITTKMVWSFTDKVEDAMHYSNGIVLVANPPENSVIWDNAAYITPLSDDPEKTEYTFMAGTKFEVQSVDNITVGGSPICVINLQPVSEPNTPTLAISKKMIQPRKLGGSQLLDISKSYVHNNHLPHSLHKTAGRRCTCVADQEWVIV